MNLFHNKLNELRSHLEEYEKKNIKNHSKFAQIRCTVSTVPYSLAKADGSAAPVRLRSHEICDEVPRGKELTFFHQIFLINACSWTVILVDVS